MKYIIVFLLAAENCYKLLYRYIVGIISVLFMTLYIFYFFLSSNFKCVCVCSAKIEVCRRGWNCASKTEFSTWSGDQGWKSRATDMLTNVRQVNGKGMQPLIVSHWTYSVSLPLSFQHSGLFSTWK